MDTASSKNNSSEPFGSTQDTSFDKPQDEEKFLPRVPLDLPLPEIEIPAHAEHGYTSAHGYDQPIQSFDFAQDSSRGFISREKAFDQAHAENSQPQAFEETDNQQYEVKTLLAWTAPGRPFRVRGKEYFASIILITFLLEIIIFLFGEYLLMVVVLSLVFVTFALALVPPHDYHYRISTEGITIEDHFYLWQELYDFYFKRRDNQDILHIRTKTLLPGELTFTLGDIHKDQIKTILISYLPYREIVHLTYMEKAGNWISSTFPLEKVSH